MRRTLGLAFTLVAIAPLLCGGAAEAAAQTAGGPCPEIYPAPAEGEFATVRFSGSAGEPSLIRFAVVDHERVEGTQHYWVEVVSEPPGMDGEVVVQMLVPYYPFDLTDIKGYIVQMPGAVPQRVPKQLLDQMLDASAAPGTGWREQCESATATGVEEVTVPAGTFRARHYEGAGPAEVWLADVPFGIVKLIQPEGTMELVGYGTDARSSLTGEPEELRVPPPAEQ